MTANGIQLQSMTTLLDSIVESDRDRYHIVGCENVDGFEAVATGDKVDAEKVEPGVVTLALDTMASFPNARAFLFECT